MSTLDRATEAVTAFAERYLRQCATPGAAIALTDAHATRATACLGFCDLEAGLRVTPQTAFGIGSVSKTLTAIAALQLRDAGLLDLDSPVDRYLPWLRLGAGRPVPTCRQLLTHTAGLPSGGLGTGGSRFELVRLADLPFLGPVPGWSYSNVGYQILGYVLEEVSSQPHAELVASGILDPLGMRGTFAPARRAAPGDRLAAGYQRTDLRPACPQEPSWRLSRFSYAGNESALAATSGDLATLVRLLLGSGAAGQARVLARRSAEEMITGQVPVRPGSQYGYGVYVYDTAGRRSVGHSGNVPGYKSMIIADLSAGLGLALLTNGPGDPTPLARYALAAWDAGLRGKPLPPPPGPAHPELPAGIAGHFSGPRGDISLRQRRTQPEFESGGLRVPAVPLGRRRFYAPHPRFDDFCFSWAEEDGGRARLYHGYDIYPRVTVTDGTSRPDAPASTGMSYARPDEVLPGESLPFLGHYRSYNPWLSNFHIVGRAGQLALLLPSGHEQPLFPGPAGIFGVGRPAGPDYLKFDFPVDGMSLRCSYSGVDYFRAPWSARRLAAVP